MDCVLKMHHKTRSSVLSSYICTTRPTWSVQWATYSQFTFTLCDICQEKQLDGQTAPSSTAFTLLHCIEAKAENHLLLLIFMPRVFLSLCAQNADTNGCTHSAVDYFFSSDN